MLISGDIEVREYRKDIRFVITITYTISNSSYQRYTKEYYLFKFGTHLNRWLYGNKLIKEVEKLLGNMGFNLIEITNFKCIDPSNMGTMETIVMDLGEKDLYKPDIIRGSTHAN